MALEFRSIGTDLKPDESGFRFQGYAAVFNTDSRGLDFTETILPGAFNRSISAATRGEWEVKAFQDHDPKMFLGSTKTGSLSLREDKLGLAVDLQLNPEVSYARDLAANLRRDGAGAGMSFGFSTPRLGDQWSSDGSRRELKSVKLHEVSVIVGGTPAYEATVGLASVRSVARLAKLDPEEVRTALSGLISGKLDAERAATVRAMLGALAPDVEPTPEPEPIPEPGDPADLPLQIRRLQLMLAEFRHPGHGDQSVHSPRKGGGAGGAAVMSNRKALGDAEAAEMAAIKPEDPTGNIGRMRAQVHQDKRQAIDSAFENPDKSASFKQLTALKDKENDGLARVATSGSANYGAQHPISLATLDTFNARVTLIQSMIDEVTSRP